MMGAMYINFGGAGAVAGMLLLGALAVYVDRVAVRRTGRWLHAWTFHVAFFGQEKTVGQSLVPLLFALVTCAVIVRVVHLRWRRSERTCSSVRADLKVRGSLH